MTWFNDLLETGGELIGGAVDTVGGFAGDVLDYQTHLSTSANPSTHRPEANDYQQPNGDVVVTKPQHDYGLYLTIGGGLLIVAGAVYLAVKK